MTKKRILILGGTISNYDVVVEANRLGYETYVTDDREDSPAKKIAKHSFLVSTIDYPKLKQIINEHNIHGVFTGPGEFNLYNSLKVANDNDLSFYFDFNQWNIFSNKREFKKLLTLYNIDTINEYSEEYFQENSIDFEVIVKPIDGSSSQGITICNNSNEVKEAITYAKRFSKTKEVMIEDYIINDGEGIDIRYIYSNGRFYPLLVGDRYILDSIDKTSYISHITVFPSKRTNLFLSKYNKKFIDLFSSKGLKTGTLFIQGLPVKDKILFHEMGLRVSGGNIYKINDYFNGINELRLMIKHVMNDDIDTEINTKSIDPYLKGYTVISYHFPLTTGKIKKIDGLNIIFDNMDVIDYIQYYKVGDSIEKEFIGTLAQLFARIKIVVKNEKDIIETIKFIEKNLRVLDESNNNMLYKNFDTKRLNL